MDIKNNNKSTILIHCQYVYGIGHFVRTIELARFLSNQFAVYILNGGEVVPNFELPDNITIIQLPEIYKEEKSDHLTPVDSSTTIDECFKMRMQLIEKSVDEITPDILITEHFPFGLLFQSEVVKLIKQVKIINHNSKIICSVRDIIESSSGGANDIKTCKLLNDLYDCVLVHGDSNHVDLSKSFPKIHLIEKPIYHTGYIVRPIPPIKTRENTPTILVSVAAGRIGAELLQAFINTHRALLKKLKHKLVLYSGAFQKDFQIQQDSLILLQSKNISIRTFNSNDYLKSLSQSTLVISLGGYNSVLEAISANKKLLIYQRQFENGNQEQNLRIKLFEERGYLDFLTENDLTSENLPILILKKLKKLEKEQIMLNFNGAKNSLEILVKMLKTQTKEVSL